MMICCVIVCSLSIESVNLKIVRDFSQRGTVEEKRTFKQVDLQCIKICVNNQLVMNKNLYTDVEI